MKEIKLVTERAHLMCPNMFFGIMIKIEKELNTQKFNDSLQRIQDAHPLISSYIDMDDMEQLYYVNRTNFEIPCYMEKDRTWKEVFHDISIMGWDVRKESLLKVHIFEESNSFKVLLVAHHILTDGRGLLAIAIELAENYTHGIKPISVEEQLLEYPDDLPEGSGLPFISKYLIKQVNKNWNKEKQTVKYDTYLEFEKNFAIQNSVKRTTISKSNTNLANITDICKVNNISVNDYLVAEMMKQENTNKVIIAADIRNKLRNGDKHVLGNYATAFSIIIQKPSQDPIKLAKQIHEKVQKIQKNPSEEMLVLSCYFAMKPTLIDAVAFSSLGNFNSKAGKFVGDKMFGYESRNGHSITNLGRIESDSISEGIFIPPASPATKKIWGVLTVNGKMQIVEVCS